MLRTGMAAAVGPVMKSTPGRNMTQELLNVLRPYINIHARRLVILSMHCLRIRRGHNRSKNSHALHGH